MALSDYTLSDYKSLEQVQQEFQIRYQEENFVPELWAKIPANDFEQGWGQCLAELVAADRLNPQPRPVYGIVTDGKLWEFGRLYTQVFTKHSASYVMTDLEKLFSVLNGLFDLATQDLQVLA